MIDVHPKFTLCQWNRWVSILIIAALQLKVTTTHKIYVMPMKSLIFAFACTTDVTTTPKMSNSSCDSYPPGAAYMRQWIGLALVQIMACRLFGPETLSKNQWQFIVHWILKTNFRELLIERLNSRKCFWKCRVRNGGHLSRGNGLYMNNNVVPGVYLVDHVVEMWVQEMLLLQYIFIPYICQIPIFGPTTYGV